MKRTATLFLLAAIILTGCAKTIDQDSPGVSYIIGSDNKTITASDRIVTRNVNTGKFQSISLNSPILVEYRQGNKTNVKIEAPDNIIGFIKVRESGGVLKISLDTKDKSIDLNGKTTKIIVTAPKVTEFHATTASNISVTSLEAKGKTVSITTESAASVVIASVNAATLRINASSASNVTINKAVCHNLTVESESASNVNVLGINATSIYANANSAAHLRLHGKCDTASLDASSAATLDASNLKASARESNSSSCASIY